MRYIGPKALIFRFHKRGTHWAHDFKYFWSVYALLNRITRCEAVRGDITVFRATFKFDNFYFNYHIEANQVNFSPFSNFELRIPSVNHSVPPYVPFGTVVNADLTDAYILISNNYSHSAYGWNIADTA